MSWVMRVAKAKCHVVRKMAMPSQFLEFISCKRLDSIYGSLPEVSILLDPSMRSSRMTH